MLLGIRLTSRADTAATVTQLYKPLPFAQGRLWGEVRYSSGTLPTDYTFTGPAHAHSHTDDFGLMYYNARWYDPALGRMAQADTIVPGAGNPMAWDRYAYALNNPVKYTDPTGHDPWYCNDARCVAEYYGYSATYLPVVSKAGSAEATVTVTPTSTPSPSPTNSGPTPSATSQPSSTPTPSNTPTPYQAAFYPTNTPGPNFINPDGIAEGGGELYGIYSSASSAHDLYTALKPVASNPGFEFGVEAALQYLADSNNSELSPDEKFNRAVLVGLEGAITDVASTSAGLFVGGVGMACGPVCAAGGYFAGSYLTDKGLSYVFDKLNDKYFFPAIAE